MNERSIFLAALDIVDSAERREYVARACAGDVVLHGQVEELFRLHEQPDGFMHQPAAAMVATVVAGAGRRQGWRAGSV
jgi:hypothetical protein